MINDSSQSKIAYCFDRLISNINISKISLKRSTDCFYTFIDSTNGKVGRGCNSMPLRARRAYCGSVSIKSSAA